MRWPVDQSRKAGHPRQIDWRHTLGNRRRGTHRLNGPLFVENDNLIRQQLAGLDVKEFAAPHRSGSRLQAAARRKTKKANAKKVGNRIPQHEMKIEMPKAY